MSSDLRPNQNQWVIATLVLGMLGLATSSFLPELVTLPPKPNDVAKDKVDQSDLLYPSTSDLISKSLGIWSDPFEKIATKLDFEKDPKPPAITNIIRDQIGSDGRLLIVAKIVSGSDSPDGIESRRRHRHAVELALAASGYSMRFPDRMTYAEGTYDYFHTANSHTSSTIDLPIKLYTKSKPNTKLDPNINSIDLAVLVVWIRDEHLGHYPMHSIAQLTGSALKTLDPIVKQSGFVICGPNSSNTLSKIADESEAARRASSNISSTHKITSDFIKQWRYGVALFNSVCTAAKTSLKPNQMFIDFGTESKLRLVHTIGTDSELTKLIDHELSLRGRGLYRSSSRTVLFVEASSQKYIEGLKAEFKANADNLFVIPYLRGIADASGPDNQITDYMDRTLADLRNASSESVTAVGVFGTQDSDKLRIFEVARSIFPTAAFFTTELDAKYSEKKNLKWCRNLLVASHYGLGCQSKWVSENMPSFRDGYQTSTFLATLIAIKCFDDDDQQFSDQNFFVENQDLSDIWQFSDQNLFAEKQDLFDICGRSGSVSNANAIKPLLFEIGNSGPIQLTDNRLPDSFSIRQPATHPSVSGNIGFILRMLLFVGVLLGILLVLRAFSNGLSNAIQEGQTTLAAVVAFFVRQIKKAHRKWNNLTTPSNAKPTDQAPVPVPSPHRQDAQTIWFVVIAALTVIGFIVAWASDTSDDGERISLLDSTSVWPSVAMFHLVTILSSAIVLRLWLEFEHELFSKGVLLAGLLFLAIFAALGFTWVEVPPARGFITRFYAAFALWAAAISLFLLASMSAISILKARKAISEDAKSLRKKEQEAENSDAVSSVQALLNNAASYRDSLFKAMEVGEASSYTLMAPAALTILLAVARLPLLDSWGIPRIWYAALMTPMLLSILAAIVMRSEARRLRYDVICFLERQQSKLLGDCANVEGTSRDRFNDCMQKINQQLGLINRLDQGPFATIYSDPILGGVLLVITAGLTGPMRDVSTWIVNAFTGAVM